MIVKGGVSEVGQGEPQNYRNEEAECQNERQSDQNNLNYQNENPRSVDVGEVIFENQNAYDDKAQKVLHEIDCMFG